MLRENTCGSDRNGSLVPKSKYLLPSEWFWPRSSGVIPLQNENQKLFPFKMKMAGRNDGVMMHLCIYWHGNWEGLKCESRPLIVLLNL